MQAEEKFENDQQTLWQKGKMSLSIQPHVACGQPNFFHMFKNFWEIVFFLNEDIQIDKGTRQIKIIFVSWSS